jgi:adenylosuccinate lyase
MRKLAASGASVQEVAEFYGIPYHRAYKAINPPRKAAGQPGSKVRMELTLARAKTLSKKQLNAIADTRAHIKTASGKLIDNPSYRARDVELAIEELERRGVRFD